MSRSSSITVDVEVEIDLIDLDSDDLVEELRRRGYTVIGKDQSPTMPGTSAERAYYALNDTVPRPVRDFVLDAAGRVS